MVTLNATDIQHYMALANHMADCARSETLPRFRNQEPVFNKAGIWFDPVTEADREAERVMRRQVRHAYPRHGILGEEFGEEFGDDYDANDKKPDYRWVFDPIDGTRAFVCGTASWMTLIALEYLGEPVLSVMDQPFTQERWQAREGKTTYQRGEGEARICQTSGVTQLDKARLSTTDPRRTVAYFSNDQADRFRALAQKVRVSRFSLDAYGYALLALGEIDLIVESGLSRYDYAAIIPVIEGAGGILSNWQGDKPGSDDRGELIAAATPQLHQAALRILQSNTD